MRFCIDPGHGGSDSGAVGPLGTYESWAVLNIAHWVAEALRAANHEVVLTREGDSFVELDDRAAFSNREEVGVFVSIHANASEHVTAGGFEVFTSPGWTPADPIATCVWNSIRECFPALRGRLDSSDGDPDKEAKFRVLIKTIAPAILVEACFISNHAEEQRLLDPGWRMRMAGSIASGLLRGI